MMTIFLQSYLLGWLFWLSLSIGCLGFLLLYQMTGGRWGRAVRPTLEAGVQLFPVWALLGVPFLYDLKILYPWMRPEMAAHPLIVHKHVWLNAPFFYTRFVIYFAVWIGLAWKLIEWGRLNDTHPSPELDEKRLRLGSLGMVAFFLTVNFASFDWMMSLDPLWGSSMYGGIFIVGSGLAAMAFSAIQWSNKVKAEKSEKDVDLKASHDVGNLMLAFTLLWTYTSLAQFLITWYGNLPEEVSWYHSRSHGSWSYMTAVVVLSQFVLPFFVLLSRTIKRKITALAWVATWILSVRFLDLYWQIMPQLHPSGMAPHVLQLMVPAALGGVWWVLFKRKANVR